MFDFENVILGSGVVGLALLENLRRVDWNFYYREGTIFWHGNFFTE